MKERKRGVGERVERGRERERDGRREIKERRRGRSRG